MERIVFMGTPDFAVPVLQQLLSNQYNVVAVVTQPDRPKGRKRTFTPPPVKVEAEKHNIPVLQPEKIRKEYQDVLAYEPDLIVTAAFGQILPKELLDGPQYGCINVHASLLPELRGGAPIHYAILEGKKETGISIMYMVEALDAGDVLSQSRVEIEETDHVGTLHDKLAESGSKLLSETLPRLLNNELAATKQDESQVTFAANIKREQERIDWNQDAETIYNHIRGMHPWPVAFTTYQNKPMKIWWGEKVNETLSGKPGEIIRLEDDGFVVVSGDYRGIKLTDIQPSGKKRMAAGDFLRGAGQSLQVGEMVGEADE
ncbi:methionyl-tRNA formyltransferase [Pontibacillus yanchengensis]|uniref:Methionyl-tRNA formyltransferase n=2 Tax=Pontibacillus yanchengensis TaxID=462910 RepID=A0ACC7VD40_9BACI|nr:methionyl-tRNA formyltransferase [Pontibacillus yanchengensis]MYL33090.1 methionyl-tRNA formyltransferase [Pontibacillus yanchengensis]MYL52060.1 methionyl-tRNA formyltransferase [Pontibacillus yanchengensis]